jgi:tRNA1(Val) A37 N6-methylase TrmN6
MKKEPQATSLLWRIRKQPSSVVTTLLSAVPEYKLLDCKTVVADLAMGDGSYLAEISRRRVANGATIEEAQKTLYGYEKSPVYLEAARKLNGLQHANLGILRPDTDLDLLSMKFDVIIGNPPYQNSDKVKKAANSRSANGSPLWVKFIRKSVELLKPDGVLTLLVPSAVATPKSRGMSAAKTLTLRSVNFGMESYFNVGTQICHISWVNNKTNAPLRVNTLLYPRELPLADVKNKEELSTLMRVWSGQANWQYMDNRGHDKLDNKENILVVRRMYSGASYSYHMGLDMDRFDKESVVGLKCANSTEAEKWTKFFDSEAGTFIRRVTNYAGNISAVHLQLINPACLM